MIRKNTWIVLGVFALSLVAFFIVQRTKPAEGQDAVPTASQTSLLDISALDLTRLEIEAASGERFVTQLDADGQWVMVEPELDPALVDGQQLLTGVTQASNLQSLTVFDSDFDPRVGGLEAPEYTIYFPAVIEKP